LYAKFSEHSAGSIFIGGYEYGTDSLFEKLAYKIQTAGNYREDNIQRLLHNGT